MALVAWRSAGVKVRGAGRRRPRRFGGTGWAWPSSISMAGICVPASVGTVEDLRSAVGRSVGLGYWPVIGYPHRLLFTGPGRHRTHDEVQRLRPSYPKLEAPRLGSSARSRLHVDNRLVASVLAPDLPPTRGDIPDLFNRAVGDGQGNTAWEKCSVRQTAAGRADQEADLRSVGASASYASPSCLVANVAAGPPGSSFMSGPGSPP